MAVKFKVGDNVRIRSWESMAQEYGVDAVGDIENGFVESMKPLCQTECKIRKIGNASDCVIVDLEFPDEDGFNSMWLFTSEMIEKVEE